MAFNEIHFGSIVEVTKTFEKHSGDIPIGYVAKGHLDSKIEIGGNIVVNGLKGCNSIETSEIKKITEENNSRGIIQTENSTYTIKKIASA